MSSKRKRLQSDEAARPTLGDVARRAGVSAATVSRYVTAPESIRAANRERVRAAIDELGYTPHGAARALASRRSTQHAFACGANT